VPRDEAFPWCLFLLILLPIVGIPLLLLGWDTAGLVVMLPWLALVVVRATMGAWLDAREARRESADVAAYRRMQARARESVRERRLRAGPSRTKGRIPPRAPLRIRLMRLLGREHPPGGRGL